LYQSSIKLLYHQTFVSILYQLYQLYQYFCINH